MLYNTGKGDQQNWIVAEEVFNPENVRKCESVMCQGNGYMGVRAATEEEYERGNRYTLVAGTFDRAEDMKTTELPNAADMTEVKITVDGYILDLSTGNYCDYLRTLNLKNGLLKREFIWSPTGKNDIKCVFERFVSLFDRHIYCARIRITPTNSDIRISLATGIDTELRKGSTHFTVGQYTADENAIQCYDTTLNSRIDFVATCAVTCTIAGHELKPGTGKNENGCAYAFLSKLNAGEELILEKYCRIATTRDNDFGGDLRELLSREKKAVAALKKDGFNAAFENSARAWQALWEEKDVKIESENPFDQLALRYAVYHLTIMAPVHDNRMNIGAKGLSGKGYWGHTFWDTEIYMLPYFIWEDPKGARSLLEYRYHTLTAATDSARAHGYQGAMFPWESAWITDGETCPSSHFIMQEHHVTADVAYGVFSYYEITGDLDFMLKCGCELLFATAQFWCSRAVFNPEKNQYEILKVIGPDEFTHEADNNAFTNYLAQLNLRLACDWAGRLKKEYPSDWERLEQKYQLAESITAWSAYAEKLYLPQKNADGLLPQDDTYLTLSEIDLTPYRQGVKKLREDYPYPSYTKLRVSKQADVMVLFLLLEDLFDRQTKQNSFYYYEPYCVHESSLSLCTYSMLSADIGEAQEAYRLYERACRIDLGETMNSSDTGIHAASLGGIWQCTVLGFLGVRLYGRKLRIVPNLPAQWKSAQAKIFWQGQQLFITATHQTLAVEVIKGNDPVNIITPSGEKTLNKKLLIQLEEKEQ